MGEVWRSIVVSAPFIRPPPPSPLFLSRDFHHLFSLDASSGEGLWCREWLYLTCLRSNTFFRCIYASHLFPQWLHHWLTDSLIDSMTNWLTNWLTVWLTAWLTYATLRISHPDFRILRIYIYRFFGPRRTRNNERKKTVFLGLEFIFLSWYETANQESDKGEGSNWETRSGKSKKREPFRINSFCFIFSWNIILIEIIHEFNVIKCHINCIDQNN